MAFTVEELKYEDDNGKQRSFNPKVFKALFTMSTPHVVIESIKIGKKPTLQDIYGELYSTSSDLIISAIAMANNLSSQQWEFVYNYIQGIEDGKTYLTGDCSKITIDNIDYIIVFLHPVTIQHNTNYNEYNKRTFIKLIPRPKVASDSGVIGD